MCNESGDCPEIKICECKIHTNHKIAEVRLCEPQSSLYISSVVPWEQAVKNDGAPNHVVYSVHVGPISCNACGEW